MNALSKILAVGVCLVGGAVASAQVPTTAPSETPTTAPASTPDYQAMMNEQINRMNDLIAQDRERVLSWVMNQQPTVELYVSYRNAGGTLPFRDFAACIAAGFSGAHQLPANYSNERTEWEKWRLGAYGSPTTRPSIDSDLPSSYGWWHSDSYRYVSPTGNPYYVPATRWDGAQTQR